MTEIQTLPNFEGLALFLCGCIKETLEVAFYARGLLFDRNPALFLELELWLYLGFTVKKMRCFLQAAHGFVCLHNPHFAVKTRWFYSLAYLISVNTVSRLLILRLSGIIATS